MSNNKGIKISHNKRLYQQYDMLVYRYFGDVYYTYIVRKHG